MRNIKKIIVTLTLLSILFVFFSQVNISYAAPAPSLSSVQITDLMVDDYNQIYVEVVEYGTSRSRTVFFNNSLCQEDYNEMSMITRNGIVIGYRRYFKTTTRWTESIVGITYNVRATYTNAMRPWNTISTSTSFTIPSFS